jgi:hypothetical protein
LFFALLFLNLDLVKKLKTKIRVTPPPGKRLEHAGIKVRLIGRVELPSDRGGKHEFVSLVRDLSPPGELGAPVSFFSLFFF